MSKNRQYVLKPLTTALVVAPLLTIALVVAQILVACGVPVVGDSPTAPEETVTSDPTFDEADVARLTTRMTWDRQSDEEQDAICWLFNTDRDLAMSSFGEGVDFDPDLMDAAEDLFKEEC